MTYVTVVCRCCKGKWRARVALPRPRRNGYLHPMADLDAICHRCNVHECSRIDGVSAEEGGCNEGRDP